MRSPRPLPEDFETTNGIASFRPHGESTLVEVVDRIAEVISYCRDHDIGKLLVHTSALDGIPIPTLVERFLMAEEWAISARGKLIVAMVVPFEYIHPNKFGAKVAADFGLTLDVFSAEAEALRWLASVPAPT